MAIPTKKNEEIESLLKDILGGTDRREVIRQNLCVPEPIGCGRPAIKFRDALSAREYTISGLCQSCQDKIFGGK